MMNLHRVFLIKLKVEAGFKDNTTYTDWDIAKWDWHFKNCTIPWTAFSICSEIDLITKLSK